MRLGQLVPLGIHEPFERTVEEPPGLLAKQGHRRLEDLFRRIAQGLDLLCNTSVTQGIQRLQPNMQ